MPASCSQRRPRNGFTGRMCGGLTVTLIAAGFLLASSSPAQIVDQADCAAKEKGIPALRNADPAIDVALRLACRMFGCEPLVDALASSLTQYLLLASEPRAGAVCGARPAAVAPVFASQPGRGEPRELPR